MPNEVTERLARFVINNIPDHTTVLPTPGTLTYGDLRRLLADLEIRAMRSAAQPSPPSQSPSEQGEVELRRVAAIAAVAVRRALEHNLSSEAVSQWTKHASDEVLAALRYSPNSEQGEIEAYRTALIETQKALQDGDTTRAHYIIKFALAALRNIG